MPIETTKDLFWLLFGLSLVVFTAFVCWGMYYFVMMVKDIREITKNIKAKLKMIEEFISLAKEKLSDTSRYLKAIVETVVKVTGWLASRNDGEGMNAGERGKKKSKK